MTRKPLNYGAMTLDFERRNAPGPHASRATDRAWQTRRARVARVTLPTVAGKPYAYELGKLADDTAKGKPEDHGPLSGGAA